MANIYVRSTTGVDTNNGSTWALAKATLTGACAIAIAGDTIFVSHVHAETSASNITLSPPGSLTAPVRILCVNDGTEPPTALATTATVTTTGGTTVNLNNCLYCYGIKFSAGTGANNGGVSLCGQSANGMQTFERCEMKVGVTPTSGQFLSLGSGGSTGSRGVHFKDTNVVFSGTGNGIFIRMCNFVWDGGSLVGITPTAGAITTGGAGSGYTGYAKISGVDFSGMSSSFSPFVWSNQGVDCWMRNCKMPVSWTGPLATGTKTPIASTFAMHNCDSADTNYRLLVEDYAGTVRSETTVVKTGGASDGTTAMSLKVDSNANTNGLVSPLIFALPAVWNDVVGVPITLTVDILHDSLTNLTDAGIWVGVEYLGTPGFPLSLLAYDSRASVLASPTDQAGSSAAWATTGLVNPNKQKLEVTVTPQERGYLLPKLYLAKTGPYTVYVDPKPLVT